MRVHAFVMAFMIVTSHADSILLGAQSTDAQLKILVLEGQGAINNISLRRVKETSVVGFDRRRRCYWCGICSTWQHFKPAQRRSDRISRGRRDHSGIAGFPTTALERAGGLT